LQNASESAKKMRSDCPISYSLDFFGDKWTFLIVRDMVFDGKKFYKDFLGSKEGIATNILSDRLKKLEQNGIIESRVYEKLKTKKEYLLTRKGKDLIPILLELAAWSSKYRNDLNIETDFALQLNRNRNKIIKNLEASLE
jgi:DNA-binding HxlR family transcriptional regulator